MKTARDFVEPGETALVVFTRGDQFKYDQVSGTGSTGEWPISPNRSYHRVIIYVRDDQAHTNRVYIADAGKVVEADRDERYIIQLSDVQYKGETSANWPQFMGTKSRFPAPYLH